MGHGPLFEISGPAHLGVNNNNGRLALHPHTGKNPFDPVDRKAFDVDRKAYWIERAKKSGCPK